MSLSYSNLSVFDEVCMRNQFPDIIDVKVELAGTAIKRTKVYFTVQPLVGYEQHELDCDNRVHNTASSAFLKFMELIGNVR